MTPEGHNDLFPALEAILREAEEPLDCNQLFDMAPIRALAPSANRVSDYLGVMFRRGLVSRVASDSRSEGSRARWKYVWKKKDRPGWKAPPAAVDYRPKAILDRPSIYITEDGDAIHIELPHLSIAIRKKP